MKFKIELSSVVKTYIIEDENGNEYILTRMCDENTGSESYEVIYAGTDELVPENLASEIYNEVLEKES